MIKYFTWEINEERGVAFRQMPDGRQVVVHLQRSENPHPHQYEGWWPDIPSQRENLTVITGICLWDGSWQVVFKQPAKRGENILANRSPALPADRAKIYDYLAKGHRIEKILIPGGPGEYHWLLLDWQRRKIRKIQPSRILYHLPVEEYHLYINQIEQLLGINIPKLHDELDLFAEKIREIIQGSFQREVVEFIRPLKMGATAPVESFLWPYLNPETLGAKPQELIGVEDLVELRLSYEAWLQRGWIIPVLCGVIKIPHPYQEKSLLGKEVKEILL